MFIHVAQKYLPLVQKIGDLLTRIVSVGTLINRCAYSCQFELSTLLSSKSGHCSFSNFCSSLWVKWYNTFCYLGFNQQLSNRERNDKVTCEILGKVLQSNILWYNSTCSTACNN